MLNQHVEQQPTDVRSLRGEVPEQLAAVVARLLEKDPADRPADRRRGHRPAGPVRADSRAPTAPAVRVPATRARRCARPDPECGDGRTTPAAVRRGSRRAGPDGPAGEFDIFDVHQRLISEYRDYTEGAAVIRDDRIAKFMDADLDAKSQWPDPWLSLNPFFADGGSVTDLADQGVLHPECAKIFQTGKTEGGTACDGQPIRFYRHQRDAIGAASGGDSYVLTTGTGSGKSLAYIVPIVDRVLRARQAGDSAKRVRAIIVYPMNALANSQLKELEKYLQRRVTAGAASR